MNVFRTRGCTQQTHVLLFHDEHPRELGGTCLVLQTELSAQTRRILIVWLVDVPVDYTCRRWRVTQIAQRHALRRAVRDHWVRYVRLAMAYGMIGTSRLGVHALAHFFSLWTF